MQTFIHFNGRFVLGSEAYISQQKKQGNALNEQTETVVVYFNEHAIRGGFLYQPDGLYSNLHTCSRCIQAKDSFVNRFILHIEGICLDPA